MTHEQRMIALRDAFEKADLLYVDIDAFEKGFFSGWEAATQATSTAAQVPKGWPAVEPENIKSGWRISFRFLQSIQKKLRDSEDCEEHSLETIEEVLVAAAPPQGESSEGWISVKDRLPAFDTVVLVSNGVSISTAYLKEPYDDEEEPTFFCWLEDGALPDTTHWQPSPPPSQKQEGDA